MFDMDFNSWGSSQRKAPRRKSTTKSYRQVEPRTRTKIVYVQAPSTRRRSPSKAYRRKRKQSSTGDYIKGTIKGAKAAYGGSKVVYKGAKRTATATKKFYKKHSDSRLSSWRDKLRGSIYKKE